MRTVACLPRGGGCDTVVAGIDGVSSKSVCRRARCRRKQISFFLSSLTIHSRTPCALLRLDSLFIIHPMPPMHSLVLLCWLFSCAWRCSYFSGWGLWWAWRVLWFTILGRSRGFVSLTILVHALL